MSKLNSMNHLMESKTAVLNTSAAPAALTTDAEKLVDAETLLSLLWEEHSRPSIRWLREQQARRTIPYVKVGARVWFSPSAVRRHLQEKWTVKHR